MSDSRSLDLPKPVGFRAHCWPSAGSLGSLPHPHLHPRAAAPFIRLPGSAWGRFRSKEAKRNLAERACQFAGDVLQSQETAERGGFSLPGAEKKEEMFRHLLTELEVKPKIRRDWFHRHVFSAVSVSVIIRTVTQRQPMPRPSVRNTCGHINKIQQGLPAILLHWLIHKLTFPLASL